MGSSHPDLCQGTQAWQPLRVGEWWEQDRPGAWVPLESPQRSGPGTASQDGYTALSVGTSAHLEPLRKCPLPTASRLGHAGPGRLRPGAPAPSPQALTCPPALRPPHLAPLHEAPAVDPPGEALSPVPEAWRWPSDLITSQGPGTPAPLKRDFSLNRAAASGLGCPLPCSRRPLPILQGRLPSWHPACRALVSEPASPGGQICPCGQVGLG